MDAFVVLIFVFPSLFRDSSDHHERPAGLGIASLVSFHPSLGIPQIVTVKVKLGGPVKKKCFHTSLGIPLIITTSRRRSRSGRYLSFHPSLGIPLIITPTP